MSSDSYTMRSNYQQITTAIHNKKFDRNLMNLIKQSRTHAERQRQGMIARQNYQDLEETNLYIEKYARMQDLVVQQKDGKISTKEFVNQAKELFPIQSGGSAVGGSTQPQQLQQLPHQPAQNIFPKTDSVVINTRMTNSALNSFFTSKNAQLQPTAPGFKSILETPQLSPRSFKKKQATSRLQLQSLISQNNLLKSQLESSKLAHQHNQNLNSALQTRYKSNQKQIQLLEKQYSKLTYDNHQLRSQRSVTLGSVTSGIQEDYLYSPYTFNTRRNNMYDINLRNMHERGVYDDGDGLSQDLPTVVASKPQTPHPQPKHHVIYKKVQYEYENYTEQDYAREHENVNFSIFDINKSYLSQNGDNPQQDRQKIGIENSRTAIRNKLAFFKPKGILIRNSDIQIGYKKSQVQGTMVRVILFFNNKNADYKTIRVDYKYEQDYYELRVTEKVRELDSFRQGREVVEVRLRGQDNLNSVIDVVVYIGSDVYKLWLPAMFLKFSQAGLSTPDKPSTKGIYASKPFSTPTQTSKIIPPLRTISTNEAQFWVESPRGSGPVNLQWKADKNKLSVSCNEKWLQFLSFLMMDNS